MVAANRIWMREFETIPIGDRWDSSARTISRVQAAAIDRLQAAQGKKLFEVGWKSLKASQWVGSLGVGRYCLDVIPKIDSPEGVLSEGQSRNNLLYMLTRTRRVPFTEAEVSDLSDTGKPLITAVLETYIRHLAFEWRRGAIRRYISQEDNRPFLKGKLLFQEQLRHNLVQKQRFYTRTDEFSADNAISQLLKAALLRSQAGFLNLDTVEMARSLTAEMDEVELRDFSSQELDQIQVDRSIARFEKLVGLAKFILRDVAPSPGLGERIYSLMFDMNQVFEEFVAAEVRHVLLGSRFAVATQVSNRSLLRRDGKGKFYLRPDIVVFLNDQPTCVIDTKWKVLDPNRTYDKVSQADMYQMYAYGKEYRVPRTVLLYPRNREIDENVAQYQHWPDADDTVREISVHTVDVSRPMRNPEAVRQMRACLKRIVMPRSLG